jgi:hypothetical protein
MARVGLATTVIALLGGIWLFLAPFIVGYQDVGQPWIVATRNDLWTGGAFVAVSLLTLILFSAFALRDAAHEARRRRLEEDSAQSE